MHKNQTEKYLYVVDNFPYQYMVSFDRYRAADVEVVMQRLHIKKNDWDFTIDAGGSALEPFRLIIHFKHERDRTLFALKDKG